MSPSGRFRKPLNRFKFRPLIFRLRRTAFSGFPFIKATFGLSSVNNEWKSETTFLELSSIRTIHPSSIITRPQIVEMFASKFDTKSLPTTYQLLQLFNIFSFPSPLTFCIFAKVQGGRRGPSALLSVREVPRGTALVSLALIKNKFRKLTSSFDCLSLNATATLSGCLLKNTERIFQQKTCFRLSIKTSAVLYTFFRR